MNDLTPPETVEQPVPPEVPEPRKTYAPWVGVVMAWLIPGSAQFLSGQRCTGVAWFFGLIFGSLFLLTFFALPGSVFARLGILGCAVYFVIFIRLLMLSYRPINRIGWVGWIAFLLLWWFVTSNIVLWSIAYIVKPYISEAYSIPGMSMAPTLQGPSEVTPNAPKIRDRIVVSKMAYRFDEPKRGDLVVYRLTGGDGKPTNYIKRIVGLPGETVDIESPYVLIDGKKVTEPPIFETMAEKRNGHSGYVTLHEIGEFAEKRGIPLPVTLGPDEYFVLGDNSEWSRDSRFTGPVKRSDILGKAIRIYWPPNRFGDLE